MDSQDLIAETNALLRQIIERDDERKREAAEAKEEFELKWKDVPTLSTDDEMSKRLEAVQEQTKQRMEELRQKDFEYKELMLKEAREQTSLLLAIREKLQSWAS